MTQIITLHYNEIMPVLFQSDAWINATQIAKQFGKKPETYLKTERTQEYVSALKNVLFPVALKSATQQNQSVTSDIPNALKSVFEQNQLVKVQSGSPETGGGTWLHPKLAIDFARWLSADFAVWCDFQIEKLLRPVEKEKPLFKPQPFTTPLHPTMMTRQMKTHVQNMIDVAIRGTNVTSNKVSLDLAAFFYCDSWDLIPMNFYPDVCAYFNVEPQFEVESTNNWVMIAESELGDLLSAKLESDRYKEERDTAQQCVQKLYQEKIALEEKQNPDEMVQKAIESIMDGIELLDTITALKQQ